MPCVCLNHLLHAPTLVQGTQILALDLANIFNILQTLQPFVCTNGAPALAIHIIDLVNHMLKSFLLKYLEL